MESVEAGTDSPYRKLESQGLSGFTRHARANVSSCQFLYLVRSPILLSFVTILIALAFLFAWEEAASLFGATTTTATITTITITTTNPATVVEPGISDPDLPGMGVALVGSAGACLVGGLLGVFLWVLGRFCYKWCGTIFWGDGGVPHNPAAAITACTRAMMEGDEAGGRISQENLEPLLRQGVGGAIAEHVAFADMPVHMQFLELANSSPSDAVVTFRSACLTYANLRDVAVAASKVLLEAGVGDGVLVALHLPGGLVAIVAILGTWIAGGAWVPIDWEAPSQRVSNLLAEMKPGALICLDPSPFTDFSAQLLTADETSLCIQLCPSPYNERQTTAQQSCPWPNGLAQIICTSGSTGAPKGVIFSHKRVAFACHFFAQHCGIKAGTKVLQKTPYIWAVFRHEVFPAVCRGGWLVVAAQEQRKDPWQLAELICSQGVEVLVATPSVLELVVEAAAGSMPSLRTAVCMGEGLQREVARRILERSGPNLGLHNFYGSTETENVFFSVPRLGDQKWEALTGRYLPAGWPQPNLSVHVLDPETLVPRPAGVDGEIFFGGILSDGYWRRPELTGQRFLDHPDFGRLYRTGDIGVWDQSLGLRVTGRTDRQVKIRGIRIELEEAEALLLEAVNAVGGSEAAVVAAPAPGLSPGPHSVGDQLALVAFAAAPPLVCGPRDLPLNANDIRQACRARMPPYMIPSIIQTLDSLPRLPNHKVDLKLLSAMAETAKETVQALDSLGMLRVLSRAQVEEDVWIQNQQAFWILIVMLGHFQLNNGAPRSEGLDSSYLAWRLEMLLGHGKDMVAFTMMVGFVDSRDAIRFGPRDWVLVILALLMSGPLGYVISPGYGPLTAVFRPPDSHFRIQHNWFLCSLMFARLVLNAMHFCKVRGAAQVALAFCVAMLFPDDVWSPLPNEWRTWLWQNDAGIQYKGFRWSFLFMAACYLLGFHTGPPTVHWARRHAPAAGWKVAALVGMSWTGFLAMSTLNALPFGYSNFQAVYNEQLSSHLITLHYMTHPSFLVYATLWCGEVLLFLLPPLFVAVAMAYCPTHFKTMGSTTLGNYVLHPTYIGAPWTEWVQEPVLSRITSSSFGPVPNMIITFLWNVAFCIFFAMTAGAAFHRGLIASFGALKRMLDAIRKWRMQVVKLQLLP